jgi:hypothetical protein
MSKPARDYEKMRPVIMRAISLGSTPERICAKHQLHWPTLMRHLRKWLNEGRPAPIRNAGPDTVFRDLSTIPVNVAASMAEKKTTRDHDPERNERIRELRRQGLSPGQINKRLGLSRGVVIGVLNRAGMTLDEAEKAKAVREGTKLGGLNKKRNAAKRDGKPSAEGNSWNFSANAHRNAAVFGKGYKGESTGPINLAKYREVAPPHAVSIEHLEGCAWPYGDVREEGISYCNKPRCRVRVHGLQMPITTAYCDHHWEKRRVSKHTRILTG